MLGAKGEGRICRSCCSRVWGLPSCSSSSPSSWCCSAPRASPTSAAPSAGPSASSAARCGSPRSRGRRCRSERGRRCGAPSPTTKTGPTTATETSALLDGDAQDGVAGRGLLLTGVVLARPLEAGIALRQRLHHLHPRHHLAEDGVPSVQSWLVGQQDVELAAAEVGAAGDGGQGHGPPSVGEAALLQGQGVARATGAGAGQGAIGATGGVARLGEGVGRVAAHDVKHQAVVEALPRQEDEAVYRQRRPVGVEADAYLTLGGANDGGVALGRVHYLLGARVGLDAGRLSGGRGAGAGGGLGLWRPLAAGEAAEAHRRHAGDDEGDEGDVEGADAEDEVQGEGRPHPTGCGPRSRTALAAGQVSAPGAVWGSGARAPV